GGAPNVVPDEAEVWYFVRGPERRDVDALTAWVRKIAQGAALMTETTVEEDFQAGCYNGLPNHALADLAERALHAVGEMSFTREEEAFGETVVRGCPLGCGGAGVRRMEQPPDFFRFRLDGRTLPSLDRGKVMSGSTDVGDVSWITPTVEVRTTCWPVGIPGHSWGITASSGSSIGHKGMLQAARAMANLAAELYRDPAHLERAREEF